MSYLFYLLPRHARNPSDGCGSLSLTVLLELLSGGEQLSAPAQKLHPLLSQSQVLSFGTFDAFPFGGVLSKSQIRHYQQSGHQCLLSAFMLFGLRFGLHVSAESFALSSPATCTVGQPNCNPVYASQNNMSYITEYRIFIIVVGIINEKLLICNKTSILFA